MTRVKFGLFLDVASYPLSYPQFKALTLRAEALGYDSVWICDHLYNGLDPVLECFTTLAAVAPITERVRLGTLVISTPIRNPAVLAKMAATLDVISEGRLEFGIGAGNNRNNEFEAYGIPLDTPRTRIKKLGEAVRLIRTLWTSDVATFTGEYYRIKDAVCKPKPVQTPHPPITIGGRGERYTIPLMARYADRSHFYGSPDEFNRRLTVLRDHCRIAKRDFDAIEKTWACHANVAVSEATLNRNLRGAYHRLPTRQRVPYDVWAAQFQPRCLTGTPDAAITTIERYVDLGVTYVMLRFVDLPRDAGVTLFAEQVIPHFT
jgi:alkanesulfonate monooxygenase SsuD/methylene tetrahydromethanopterin reductase-like flavin-dependent oxidoreductase (luciferase family)